MGIGFAEGMSSFKCHTHVLMSEDLLVCVALGVDMVRNFSQRLQIPSYPQT